MKPRCMMVGNFVPLCSIWDMGRDIRTALENAGVSVMEYMRADAAPTQLHHVMLKYIIQYEGPKFLFDFNAAENYETGGESVYDKFGLPRFSFVEACPTRHMDKILALPKRSIISVVDRDFVSIPGDYGAPCQKVIALPHAGPPPLGNRIPNGRREDTVLVVGNIGPAPELAAFLDENDNGDPTVRKALDRMVERGRTETVVPYRLVADELPGISLERRSALTNALESFLIATRRRDLLLGLADRPVEVFGLIDETARRTLPDTFSYGGEATFERVLDRMEQVRIVVNSSPSFRNGGHERIFYGLSRGAAIVTEPTRLFTETEIDAMGLSILPFDATKAGDAVEQAMSRDDGDIEAAQESYSGTHTWAQRVDGMLAHIRAEFWDG